MMGIIVSCLVIFLVGKFLFSLMTAGLRTADALGYDMPGTKTLDKVVGGLGSTLQCAAECRRAGLTLCPRRHVWVNAMGVVYGSNEQAAARLRQQQAQ